MNRYPTDEELNALIEEMEMQELYAPRNLKEQILNRISASQSDIQPDGAAEREVQKSKNGGIHRSVQFFSYSAKIVAGMAAAIAMLLLVPQQGSQAKGVERIVQEKQQNREAYARREAEMQRQKAREAAWEKGTEEVQQKIENMLSGFDGMWNREMEED